MLKVMSQTHEKVKLELKKVKGESGSSGKKWELERTGLACQLSVFAAGHSVYWCDEAC